MSENDGCFKCTLVIASKLMELSTTFAKLAEAETENALQLQQLSFLQERLEEVLETYNEEEKGMYIEKISSAELHPSDRLNRIINENSDSDLSIKKQKSRENTLNLMHDFIDPFTIKRSLIKE